MSGQSHKHHYISQCYLKGFITDSSKKPQLLVIDLEKNKSFRSSPEGIGCVRHFNRVEIDGIDPNTVEHNLSVFEGKVAPALREIEENLIFEGNNKEILLNFIALLTRSPQKRERWREFQQRIINWYLDLTLQSPDRYKKFLNDKI